MDEKRRFYARYGAEEYYVLYPDRPQLWEGWRREGEAFVSVGMNGFISPRLGIRFESAGGYVAVYHPNGERFLTHLERAVLAEQEHTRADQEQAKAARLAARLRELGVDPDTV